MFSEREPVASVIVMQESLHVMRKFLVQVVLPTIEVGGRMPL